MALTPLNKGLSSTKSSSGAAPDGCVVLDNFVVTSNGQLVKRPGTKYVVDSVLTSEYFVKQLASTYLLIGKNSTSLSILDVDGVTVKSFSNLYTTSAKVSFFNVDDPDFYSVVVFGRDCNTIQINFAEYIYDHPGGSVSITLPGWKAASTFALVDGKRIYPAITVSGDDVTVTYGSVATISLIHMTYSVWVPSQYFFGNEFFSVVSKSAQQKSVLIPEQLTTDLEGNESSLIKVYTNDNTTQFNVTQTPRLPNDVAFSDGQEYEYSVGNEIKFSPYFLTFGQLLYDVAFDLSILNIDVVNDTITLQSHGLKEGMLVEFTNEAPAGVTIGTSYVVTSVSSNSFKLQTLAGAAVNFTTALNTTTQTYLFSSEKIRQDGGINVTGANFTGKKKFRLTSSVVLPSALENNKDYFVSVSSGVLTFYSSENPDVQILVSRIKTTSFDASSIDYLNDAIKIPGHGYFNSQPVAIVDSTQLVSPLVLNTKYYVRVVDADTIQLYTDKLLQNLIEFVVTGTVSVALDFRMVNFSNNRITKAAHGFTSGQAVVIEDERPIVQPLDNNVIYFVKVYDANTFSLCFDRNLQAEVDLFIPSEDAETFANTDVNTTTDEITITSHGYANSQVVMFLSSTLPAPLTPNTFYYVSVVDDNTIKLYTDSGLSNLVNLTTTGSSVYTIYKVVDYSVDLLSTDTNTEPIYITDAWGDVTLTPEYQTGQIQTATFSTALLSRRRRIKFNSSSIRVIVDNVEYTRATSQSGINKYYVTNTAGTVLAGTPNGDNFISFEATDIIGVSASAFVELIDSQKGSSMNAAFVVPTNFSNDRYSDGSLIRKYGYADFFDISTPPSEVTVSNSRLYLGAGVKVVVSELLDSLYNNRYYSNFTIDDRLQGTASEPFYFVLTQSGNITAMVEFQNNLFIFTTRAVFRLDSPTAVSYIVQNIANQGASNKNCVTKLQSFIVYANDYGVFLLNSEVQDLYYAQELSVNINERIKGFHCVSLVFDPARDCLYTFGETYSYCYNVLSQAWSTFRFPFKVNQGFFTDEVYLVVEELDTFTLDLVKFADVPLDLYRDYSGAVVNSGDVRTANLVTLLLRRLGFPSVLISGVYKLSNYVTPLAADTAQLRTVNLVDRVESGTNTHYINGAVLSDKYGYEIQSLAISGATHFDSLNYQGTNLHLLISIGLDPSVESEMSVGTLYGSDPTPEVFEDIVAVNDIPDFANFAILKEPIQAMANSYQCVVYSNRQYTCNINGYELMPINQTNNYYSGGR